MNAKHAFHTYVAGKRGFPDGMEGINEARECLLDASEVYSEQGGTVEPGMSFPY